MHNAAKTTQMPIITAAAIRLEPPLAAVMRSKDSKAVGRAAHTLWCAIHGLTTMSTNAKLVPMDVDVVLQMAEDLVDCYLAGLAVNLAGRPRGYRDRPPAPR